MLTFVESWLEETRQLSGMIAADQIDGLARALEKVRRREGRVYVLGLGGSAANAEHCVNDLRMRCHLDAQAPMISEWTARANDQGWLIALREWLRCSRLSKRDAVLFLSGSGESPPLLFATRYARSVGAQLCAIVGNATSALAKECDHVVVIPTKPEYRAGHAETFQSVVWHCVAAHPRFA